MKERLEISLCGLDQPLDHCKNCYRNPENTEPEPLQVRIRPTVEDGQCSHYVPINAEDSN